ncbi:nucleoside deaminase [Schinkia azotoformans]|uniref:Cytidine/deoxycytidylate deaminase family protein, guanine deaminase n=1 Tax=Schinkia azotoformans LMG 9581 TaxID=1131731 RepID=K6D5E6_SCHAZ|nr:nucleoside deaminase [Schinkia azotoformans]EKN63484.1 cytidine/deoxycytidylate deaminase family protein, guanine deaminase [Schinkia azotoformans LMG 9581]MEC1638783.1 nucleoside deaminase [Schinkia azotoformans]MEC1720808.1 nucleoside deaminase [Schinkia azotoformans]MEC1946748.1 nucleoside deaminase [Schinkia azotoformans]MED4353240.1 nucleoside deaminase [Schinkia azotoformans]
MNIFMKRAVELAVINVNEGGQPFGAVLVKNNEVVTEGVNELHKTYDVSGHAELIAIRRAQAQLQTNNLSGYTMYASGEPCPMCLTAMYFAGIEEVFYCQSVADAVEVGLGKSKFIYDEFKESKDERKIKMKQMRLNENQENPMNLWKQTL